MKTRILHYFPQLLTALLPLLLYGCTAGGAYIGYTIDTRNACIIRAGRVNADTINVGSRVNVTLVTGQNIAGEFKGLRPLLDKDYSADYLAARSALANTIKLPNLGDTLTAICISDERLDFVFRGFGPQSLAMNSGHSSRLQYFPLTDVATLSTCKRQPISLERIRSLLYENRLPLNMGAALRSGTKAYLIPLNHVKEICTQPRHTCWWIAGATVGCVVDATILGLLISKSVHDKMPKFG